MTKDQRTPMKMIFSILALLTATVTISVDAQSTAGTSKSKKKEISSPASNLEQEVIDLSKQKWQWMSERKVELLDALLHERAVFVHMGATMTKKQELDVIRGGAIQYKKAEIQETSVRIIDRTAVLLNKIRLVAIVGGNEVINPFVVTEVYVRQSGKWKLASLSFTRLLT
jgi:4-carboxymuconolactone decarboxylase